MVNDDDDNDEDGDKERHEAETLIVLSWFSTLFGFIYKVTVVLYKWTKARHAMFRPEVLHQRAKENNNVKQITRKKILIWLRT